MEHINWTKEFNVEHKIANIKMLKIFLSEHIDNKYYSTVVFLKVNLETDFSKGKDSEYSLLMKEMYIANNEIKAIDLCSQWISNNLGEEFQII